MPTHEEMDAVREGLYKWAKASWDNDWWNQRRWWTRFVHWYCWKVGGVYLPWHDESEILASLQGYIARELEPPMPFGSGGRHTSDILQNLK